jgi:hypothetical protein
MVITMAINTENKRRSVTGIMPVPNGFISATDRAQATWMYLRFFWSSFIAASVHHFNAAAISYHFSDSAQDYHFTAADVEYHFIAQES